MQYTNLLYKSSSNDGDEKSIVLSSRNNLDDSHNEEWAHEEFPNDGEDVLPHYSNNQQTKVVQIARVFACVEYDDLTKYVVSTERDMIQIMIGWNQSLEEVQAHLNFKLQHCSSEE
jgi:hypothetical protein